MQKKKSRSSKFRPLPRKMRKKSASKLETKATQPNVSSTRPKDLGEEQKKDSLTSPGSSQGVSVQQELESQWKTKYEELNNKYQFLLAEYANYKKQNFKQMERLRKYEGQNLIYSLLEKVVDNFDLALRQKITEQNSVEFKKGIQMIYTQLQHFLKEVGVKEAVQVGEPFNPVFHNALAAQSTQDMPPDHVLHIIKKAYMFHDKLIRPAEVIVSKQEAKKVVKPTSSQVEGESSAVVEESSAVVKEDKSFSVAKEESATAHHSKNQ